MLDGESVPGMHGYRSVSETNSRFGKVVRGIDARAWQVMRGVRSDHATVGDEGRHYVLSLRGRRDRSSTIRV